MNVIRLDAPPLVPALQGLAGPVLRRLRSGLSAYRESRPLVDLLVTANDMNMRHGTGVLMTRIMEEAPPYIAMRAFNDWGGEQTIRPLRSFCLNRYNLGAKEIERFTLSRLDHYRIRRILTICFTREDAQMSVTAQRATGAPLTLYVMDDNALLTDGIPRALFEELVALAERRFVIGPTMRDAYTKGFRREFHVLPPVVHSRLIRAAPSNPAAPGRPRGVIVGNIWHQTWLDRLLDNLPGTGAAIQWFPSWSEMRWLSVDAGRLAAAGIEERPNEAPEAIAAALETSHFALIPSSDGAETDQHARAIGRLSLPSKIPFILASAGTPMLVVHDAPSGGADFVTAFGLGCSSGYDREGIMAAARELADPATQLAIRRRSFELSRSFESRGICELLLGERDYRQTPFSELFGEGAPPA